MFLARDEKGDLVNSLEDDLVKQDYTCPACGSIVQLRRGQNKRAHFAINLLRIVIFSMKTKVLNI
mgnify:CR=1 FL=1